MVTIANVDHILALVRGQLERVSRDKRVGPNRKTGRTDGARATEKSRLQAITSLADVSDEEFEHLLVGALLSHEFGEEAARDPRFQSVVDRAWNMMRSDEDIRALMNNARQLLKSEGPAGKIG